MVEALIDPVPGAADHAGVGALLPIDDGQEDIFAGVVVHPPESDGSDEGNLGLLVIEQGAQVGGEVAASGLAGGENCGGSNVQVVIA